MRHISTPSALILISLIVLCACGQTPKVGILPTTLPPPLPSPVQTTSTLLPLKADAATSLLIQGQACPACIIEVFVADALGQGQTYLLTVVADQHGQFSFVLPEAFADKPITTTATDPDGNTSEFSPAVDPKTLLVRTPEPSVEPSETVTETATNTPTATSVVSPTFPVYLPLITREA
jgi:hypothetical protein